MSPSPSGGSVGVRDLPAVVNAPMAGVAGGALAAAVTRAGGLGFIGGGYGDMTWIDEQLDIAPGTAVGVGLITWALADRQGLVEHVVRRGVRWVWLSFGDPAPHVGVVHDAGAAAWCQVQTVADARRVAAAGADVIVAQGNESGGHGRDNQPLAVLLPEVIAAVAPIPVLAAGGITTADDRHRAMGAGAAGVVVGTRLYASHEALDTDAAKARLVAGSATCRTIVFDLRARSGVARRAHRARPRQLDGRALAWTRGRPPRRPRLRAPRLSAGGRRRQPRRTCCVGGHRRRPHP